MTTIGVPAALGDDVLGEDWFGEGSVFDSGEELAAALLALASSAPDAARVARPSLPAAANVVLRTTPPPRSPAGATPRESATEQIGEFQVAAMPSFAKRVPARANPQGPGWQRSPAAPAGPQATGWSIRQSVQILRTTEEILVRLREEAAALAWQWAAAVHHEVSPALPMPAAGPD